MCYFDQNEDNTPNLKLFSGIKIIKGFFFIYQTPWPFSRQCQVFHFRTYPEFETLSRFRDKTHFPQFKTKLKK